MRSLVLLAVLSVGCEVAPAPAVPAPRFVATTLAIVPAAPPPLSRQPVPALQRLGLTQSDELLVVADGGVSVSTGDGLQRLPLYAAAGEPLDLGTVTQLEPRQAGGAWLASTSGLYLVDGPYLARSPLSVGEGAIHAATEVAQGPLQGLWLLSDLGLSRWTAKLREAVMVAPERPSQLAVARDGQHGLLLHGATLSLLRPQQTPWTTEALPPELEFSASQLAAGRTVLAALGERQVLLFDPALQPPWRLINDVDAQALAVDPLTDTLWLQTQAQLLRVDGETATAFSFSKLQGQPAISTRGEVLTREGDEVVRLQFATTPDVSFAADVRPFLAQHCERCHGSYLELSNFSPHASSAWSRLRAGDMPRCEGSTRCPTPLEKQRYAVLEAWIRGGKRP